MKENKTPTNSEVVEFKMLQELIDSVYTEMKEFSKKKPDEALNKFKVKNVNRILIQIKNFLSEEPTSDFLDILDDETLPSNSDAILVIGQFQAAMSNFKKKNTRSHNVWVTEEHPHGKSM